MVGPLVIVPVKVEPAEFVPVVTIRVSVVPPTTVVSPLIIVLGLSISM
jgi:hypothetical protein